MSTTYVPTPMSHCHVGMARCDITPPIGIYHRFWGAASHDQATGVHRPLTATVLTFAPAEDSAEGSPFVFVAIDHCLFRPHDMEMLLNATSERIGVPTGHIHYCFSHTHSGGHICSERSNLPGGEMIVPYLEQLPEKVAGAYETAIKSIAPMTMTYATTTCEMGHNRDYKDDENGIYACGYNPEAPTGLPVNVVRLTDESGDLAGTIVSYPCHPTTLAWDNTLISPDYIGALRETVEEATGKPCLFFPAPCGDIGPKVGFVGDLAVADRNGRQLAYAALSALESMPCGQEELHYAGPVISGATIGAWESRPIDENRLRQMNCFRCESWNVSVPYMPNLPTLEEAQQELSGLLEVEEQQREAGKATEARDTRALAERKRREIERLRPLPPGDNYPYAVFAWQLGDAFWVTVEGEPYQSLQRDLAEQFPNRPVMVIPLDNGARCGYLPSKQAYDKPLYQVEIATVAAGSLELVTESIVERLSAWDVS